MVIRKLTESDYDMVIELYRQLDEMHVQARPDYFVHRDKEKIYPKDAFLHNLSYPGGLELGAFEDEQLVGIVSATLWEESGMIKDVKTVCLDNLYVLGGMRNKMRIPCRPSRLRAASVQALRPWHSRPGKAYPSTSHG